MTISFEGMVVNAKTLTSKTGKDYAVFTFERQDKYKDTVTVQQYEATAFGERINAAHVGDVVNVTLRVGTRFNKERYWPSFTVISVTKLGSVAGAVKPDKPEDRTAEPADDPALPF